MKKLFVIIAINFMYNGCGIYTFSGASIPNEAKTIGINYFTNKAANVQPILSQLFTEKLKDRVVEQTRLILSDEGDLQFSGFISEYTIKPIAITSTETASKSTCGVLPLLPRLIPSGKATLSDSNVFSNNSRYFL